MYSTIFERNERRQLVNIESSDLIEFETPDGHYQFLCKPINSQESELKTKFIIHPDQGTFIEDCTMSDFYTSAQSSAKSFSPSTSSTTFSSYASFNDSNSSLQPIIHSGNRSRLFSSMLSSSTTSFPSNVCTIDSSDTRFWQSSPSNVSSSSPQTTKKNSGQQTVPRSETSDHRPQSPESFERMSASNSSKLAVFHDPSDTKTWFEQKVRSHRHLNRKQREEIQENPQFYTMEKPPMKYHRSSSTRNRRKENGFEKLRNASAQHI